MSKKSGLTLSSAADNRKYELFKSIIEQFIAEKEFTKAKEQYDNLFSFLRAKSISKTKIREYKIEIDFVMILQTQHDFTAEEVKRLIEDFHIDLTKLITSVHNKGKIEKYDFCFLAVDILYKCWQGDVQNIKDLLQFFTSKGVPIQSDVVNSDMLLSATVKYHPDHEFIRALLETGEFELNRYFIADGKSIISAFSFAKALMNADLVSVFLDHGANPNFLDLAVAQDKKLFAKLAKGQLKKGGVIETQLPYEQQLACFAEMDRVIEESYKTKLRKLLDQYCEDLEVETEAAAASVGTETGIKQIMATFDRYLFYKSSTFQEELLTYEAKQKHAIEAGMALHVLSALTQEERDSKKLMELLSVTETISDVEVRNKYTNLFEYLRNKPAMDVDSFVLGVIRDFLDFKDGKLFDITSLEIEGEFESLAAQSPEASTVSTSEKTPSGSSEEDTEAEDEWDQLALEISETVNSDEDECEEDEYKVYESGESDDEEEELPEPYVTFGGEEVVSEGGLNGSSFFGDMSATEGEELEPGGHPLAGDDAEEFHALDE